MNDIEVVRVGLINSDDRDADEINDEHDLFCESQKTALEHAFRCGELLVAKKASMAHGEWMPWVNQNCNFTVDMADRYMRLGSNSERVLNLDGVSSIRSALKVIAEHKKPTPKEPVETDWSNDARIKAMMDGIIAIRQGVAILRGNTTHTDTAKYYLKAVKESLIKILANLEEY